MNIATQEVCQAMCKALRQVHDVLRWCGSAPSSSKTRRKTKSSCLQQVTHLQAKTLQQVSKLIGADSYLSSSINKCFYDQAYGVYVVWAESQNGKTTYTKYLLEAWRRKDPTARLYTYIDSYSLDVQADPCKILAELHVQTPFELAQQLHFQQKTMILVLDQFDSLLSADEAEAAAKADVSSFSFISRWCSFLAGLAAASQKYKTFRVIVNLHNCLLADCILHANHTWHNIQATQSIFLATEHVCSWQPADALEFLGNAASSYSPDMLERFKRASSKCSIDTLKLIKLEPWRLLDADFNMLIENKHQHAKADFAYLLNYKSRQTQQHAACKRSKPSTSTDRF